MLLCNSYARSAALTNRLRPTKLPLRLQWTKLPPAPCGCLHLSKLLQCRKIAKKRQRKRKPGQPCGSRTEIPPRATPPFLVQFCNQQKSCQPRTERLTASGVKSSDEAKCLSGLETETHLGL